MPPSRSNFPRGALTMIDIRGLAYFVAQIDDLEQWRRYAEDVLGMMTSPAPGEGLYIKMDERPFRILVVRGDAPRYVASGWELANERAFQAALAELEAAPSPTARWCRCCSRASAFRSTTRSSVSTTWSITAPIACASRRRCRPVRASMPGRGSKRSRGCPEFDSSETHFRPTSSNGAGFRAMIRQNPRYMDC